MQGHDELVDFGQTASALQSSYERDSLLRGGKRLLQELSAGVFREFMVWKCAAIEIWYHAVMGWRCANACVHTTEHMSPSGPEPSAHVRRNRPVNGHEKAQFERCAGVRGRVQLSWATSQAQQGDLTPRPQRSAAASKCLQATSPSAAASGGFPTTACSGLNTRRAPGFGPGHDGGTDLHGPVPVELQPG